MALNVAVRHFARFWGEGKCQVLQSCLEGLGIQRSLLSCLVMFQRRMPSFISTIWVGWVILTSDTAIGRHHQWMDP